MPRPLNWTDANDTGRGSYKGLGFAYVDPNKTYLDYGTVFGMDLPDQSDTLDRYTYGTRSPTSPNEWIRKNWIWLAVAGVAAAYAIRKS